MKDGGAGDQEQVTIARELVLMSAKEFAEAALGAITVDGVADSGRGGNYAGAWCSYSCSRISRRPGPPPDGQGTGIDAAAFGADSTNFILAAKVLLRAKTHGPWRVETRPKPHGIKRRSGAYDL
jgi:hypothetical protein